LIYSWSLLVRSFKVKYCIEKTARVVLGTVSALLSVKKTFWIFMSAEIYWLFKDGYFCDIDFDVSSSPAWRAVRGLHHTLTRFVPFLLILLFNVLAVKHIRLSRKIHRKLRTHKRRERPGGQQIEKRRKAIILLFVLSGNFALLWSMLFL